MRPIILIGLALCGCDGVFKLVEVRDPVSADAGQDSSDADGVVVTDGLVARYALDTFDGGIVLDAHGPNHGSCESSQCPVPTQGLFGGAALFDGAMQQVVVPATNALITTSGFTVVAWVRLDELDGSSCPMSKQYADSHYNTWQLCALDTRDLRFYSYDGSLSHDLAGPKLPVGEWHHVGMRYDGVRKSIVLDGIIGVENDATISFDSSSITFGSDIDVPQIVGGFGGAIDEVRIYNRALTQAELGILATRPF